MESVLSILEGLEKPPVLCHTIKLVCNVKHTKGMEIP